MNPMCSALTILSLLALLLTPPLTAQSGNAIGSLPATQTNTSTPQSTTVKAGESATNSDGVTVANNANSQGTAKLTPKAGATDAETSVVTKSGFTGSVTGLDSNDNVTVGPNNTVDITGEGGTVNVAGGSTVNVKNTSPSTGGHDIIVQLPAGGSVIVPPGNSAKVTT